MKSLVPVAKMKVVELRAELKKLGLPTDGLKAVLLKRLQEAIEVREKSVESNDGGGRGEQEEKNEGGDAKNMDVKTEGGVQKTEEGGGDIDMRVTPIH